jgi:IclR family acetate operon transcriptional repressor
MANEKTPSNQVKSATRTLDIIEFIVAQDHAVTAQHIASALAIPVSSLSYLLATLVDREYLTREGRRYKPGPGLARLQARETPFTLAERVAPLVRTLRVQLNETASFFIRVGWEVEAIATETSEHALRYAISTGVRNPMHALSSGKALLAALDDADLERFFAEAKLEKFTPKTCTSKAKLRKEIAEIRRTGLAYSREEFILGIGAIACPVRTPNGEALGALSVAVPIVRHSDEMEHKVVKLLQRSAKLFETS